MSEENVNKPNRYEPIGDNVSLKREVIVKLAIEGIHQWKDCPIEEVSFLKVPHRHMFHIKAYKIVSHGDRDVEIIRLKRDIEDNLISNFYCEKSRALKFNNLSCEHIAEHLLRAFGLSACEVLEDNENGGRVSV